jgi:SAM-dependent methyltransferase
VMLVLAATVALNVYLFVLVPKGLFPTQDTGRMIGGIQADQSISFQLMRDKLTQFISIVRKDKAIDSVVGFTGGGQTNSGFVFIALKPRSERGLSADAVIARLRRELSQVPGASLFLQSVQDIRVGGRQSNAQYQFTLQADSLDDLAFASRKPPELMHHRLVECPVCDLLYASPAPTAEQLEGAYEEAGFDSAEEARFASQTYARLAAPLLSEVPVAGGVVDVGTGDGAFLGELLERGLGPGELVGVEPSAAPIAAADPEVRPLIRHALLSATYFDAESFRLVTCFQTIEHLADPREFFAGARRILAPGGALMIVCHDRRSLVNRMLGKRSPIFDVQHMQLFSRESMKELMARSGFERVRLRHIVNRYPLRYWMRLAPLPKSLKERARASRLGTLALPLPVGNMVAIGFKPAAQG